MTGDCHVQFCERLGLKYPGLLDDLQPYYKFDWKIGNSLNTSTEKTTRLHFNEAIGHIDVQLIAQRQRNAACFPQDDGIDTIIKHFYVVKNRYAPIIGRYEGYFKTNPNQKEVVEVKYMPSPDPDNIFGDQLEIININKGCNTFRGNPPVSNQIQQGTGARAISINATGQFHNGCNDPTGFMKLVGRDSLKVDFSERQIDNLSVRTKDSFVGRRIRK